MYYVMLFDVFLDPLAIPLKDDRVVTSVVRRLCLISRH
jgi:hypothetical protein